ncbi:MAG: hypothetical protein C0499_06075 [Zymomonas sp.]|uniref:DUF2141 domain-containing protein n=1 Tax=Sphingomonas sp. TaxID=28214 RepID=UPI000DB7E8C8|nr:hypothetical protein [Zymomonas sp.]PZP18444.1 MAG: hypothetical protein DI607_04985 [Sphingomonas hengshuiensis]
MRTGRGLWRAAITGGVTLVFAPAALAARGDTGLALEVIVTNVRATSGKVHLDLCRESEFLKKCAISAEAPAVRGTTIIKLANIEPGDYAVQATYDENDNGKVDRGLFGIPKEGVGFSNDAPIRLGPPRWKDAVFTVNADKSVALRLRYLMGGDDKP